MKSVLRAPLVCSCSKVENQPHNKQYVNGIPIASVMLMEHLIIFRVPLLVLEHTGKMGGLRIIAHPARMTHFINDNGLHWLLLGHGANQQSADKECGHKRV